MARIRLITPGAPVDEDVATMSLMARYVWAYLPCHADKEGRLRDAPFTLKLAICPLDQIDMEAILGELASRRHILRYEVDGRRYVQIRNFAKYQKPHRRETDSELPGPPRAVDEQPKVVEGPPWDDHVPPEADHSPPDPDPVSDPGPVVLPTGAHDPGTPSQPRDSYGLIQLFGRAWRSRYNEPWIRDQWDPKAAESFIEAIRGLSPPDQDASFAAIPGAVARYFASNNEFYVERRHPFQSFAKDFNVLRKGPKREPQMIGRQKIAVLPVA